MEFKRNLQAAERGQISRKVIMLIMAVVILISLGTIWQYQPVAPVVNIIKVEMLNKNQFIIGVDTTNFDRFASILKDTVIQAKKNYKYNQIQLFLPTTESTAELTDIIQIVTAMNLDWEIKK